MNLGVLLCFVLTAGLGVISMSKGNNEKNIGAKRERFRRSNSFICADCEELTETSGVVGINSSRPGTLQIY